MQPLPGPNRRPRPLTPMSAPSLWPPPGQDHLPGEGTAVQQPHRRNLTPFCTSLHLPPQPVHLHIPGCHSPVSLSGPSRSSRSWENHLTTTGLAWSAILLKWSPIQSPAGEPPLQTTEGSPRTHPLTTGESPQNARLPFRQRPGPSRSLAELWRFAPMTSQSTCHPHTHTHTRTHACPHAHLKALIVAPCWIRRQHPLRLRELAPPGHLSSLAPSFTIHSEMQSSQTKNDSKNSQAEKVKMKKTW